MFPSSLSDGEINKTLKSSEMIVNFLRVPCAEMVNLAVAKFGGMVSP